jgi:hypothetical protein
MSEPRKNYMTEPLTDKTSQAIYLGSLQFPDARAMMRHATKLARELARRIEKQKLYKLVGEKEQKKFVRVEGWAILGAMIGVAPVEEFCENLPAADGSTTGYRAKVELIRLSDCKQIGGASALCYINEKDWEAEAFATYSKTITRATSKAFRLSFAWIMTLAGFEATPAEEMYEVEGSQEQATDIGNKRQVEIEAKKQGRKEARTCVFMTWPEEHHGHNFFLTGLTVLYENFTIEKLEAWGGRFNDRDRGFYFSAEHADAVRSNVTKKIGADRFIERKYGDGHGRNSATQISGEQRAG